MLAQIKSIIYPRAGQKPPQDSTYAIVRAQTEEHGPIVLHGALRRVSPGEWLDIEATFEPNFNRKGPRYLVKSFKQVIPHGTIAPAAKAKWLSDHIPGVGRKKAEEIVNEIGMEYLIDNPTALLDYVSPKYQQEAIDTWKELSSFINLDTVLETVGIVGKRREALIAHYGGPQATLNQLRHDPWALSKIGLSFTFPTLDRLGVILNLPLDHPSRLEACATFCLGLMCQNNGDTMQPNKMLFPKLRQTLNSEVTDDQIRQALDQNPEIKTLGPAWSTLTALYDAERGIRAVLKNLSTMPGLNLHQDLVDKVSAQYHLDTDQCQALAMMNTRAICALTGGPGTGKTTTLGAFVHLVRRGGKKLALVAPTGLAARHLSDVSDHPATTIHRWLGKMERNPDEDEFPDILIIDETSMLSSALAARVMRIGFAVAGRIVLVGDPDQLPPIEPGSPFKDILNHSKIPSVRLTKIWRQSGDSIIPIVAKLLRQGDSPHLHATIGKQNIGWRYTECNTPAEVEKEASIESIRQHQAFEKQGGSVTLAPIYADTAGIRTLNASLQRNLNPHPNRYFKGEAGEWRTGDPCIHIGNDYPKKLTHAMRGTVVDIRQDNKVPSLIVLWEDGQYRTHPCPEGDASRIVLGYVLSYHRSQGSEYPGVVVALTNRQLVVANREAIYTAVTRAKKEVILVAEKGALESALRVRGSERKTTLSYLLRKDSELSVGANHV